MLPRFEFASGLKIVHFHQSHSGGVVYTAHDRRVVTRWQVCDDRRFSSVTGHVPAGLDFADLAIGDNPTDYRRRPVVIGGNQRSRGVMQLQCRIALMHSERHAELALGLWHE